MALSHRLRPLQLSNLLCKTRCPAITQNCSFYEQTRSGNMTYENKKIEKDREKRELHRMKEKFQEFKKESKWFWRRFKDKTIRAFKADQKGFRFEDQELVKFWDFNQANNDQVSSYPLDYKDDKQNDMLNLFSTCDSDYDVGFSKCSWTVSPSGHGLFSGYLDTTVPNDGKVWRAGYAYLGTQKAHAPFSPFEQNLIFSEFTHIVLRVRGDGRQYSITFDTSDIFDITWFDRYQFMLYTHGGPYWQYVKIPLTRFYFHYQGFIQDQQYVLNPGAIRSLGILATGRIAPGPFSLEIDYIGFMQDSQANDIIEYETYFHESSQFKSLGSL